MQLGSTGADLSQALDQAGYGILIETTHGGARRLRILFGLFESGAMLRRERPEFFETLG